MYTGFLFIFGSLVAVRGGGVVPPYFAAYLAWFFVGANLFGMLLNDYFDRELDKHNPRKTKTRLSVREYVLGIAAALLSYALLAVLFPNLQALVWVLVAVFANIAYSVPPLRLKEYPPFDVLGGPASYLTALLAGYALCGGGWPSVEAGLAGLLFFCGIDLAFKTLDIEADAEGGVRTSATVLGRTSALVVSALLMFGAAFFVGLERPLYALGALPYLLIFTALHRARTQQERTVLDARLPTYYFAAGFLVTVAFWCF